ncbi:hypothetical protein RND81_10G044700 [Saponaria officinalis]|uniref:Uncharacterized protein n=1 Tax=Saponaria officinalis TaxID=3572 RepID=A0AAW1HY40_SAPOF
MMNMAEDKFATFTLEKIQLMPDSSSHLCIYKAPNFLRQVNEECYRPYFVSIGPLYYGLALLEPMQYHKLRCLKFILELDCNPYRSNLEHYMRIIREMEGRVRDCYAEMITLPSNVFNKMILVDSMFIIFLFMTTPRMILPASSREILDNMQKKNIITWEVKLRSDLFQLENQVPLFVLELLFDEVFGAAYPHTSFRELALDYMTDRMPFLQGYQISEIIEERIKNASDIAHLVDLLMMSCYPTTRRCEKICWDFGYTYTNDRFPSVSNLRAAGVKFKASKKTNLMDITFSKGVLQIPPITLWDTSESLYRNMILFEQSHIPLLGSSYIADYMVFLDNLIKTPEDVQILVERKIIDNGMGSDDAVVSLFSGITIYVAMRKTFYYFDVRKALNEHANTKWNNWKATLKKEYFGHPWATISVIYALILFILTLIQTIGTFTTK